MSRIRTSLSGRLPITPWDDEQLRAKAKRLWHEKGSVLVMPNWLPNDFDRQHMVNIAQKLFGARGNNADCNGVQQ